VLVPPREVSTVERAREVFEAALAAGHEGVVVKATGAPYDVGTRGSVWIKVSRATRSTWSCSPQSGGTAGAAAGCPTCTWAAEADTIDAVHRLQNTDSDRT
jgi:hypothetical protein